jgi:peptide deformylase
MSILKVARIGNPIVRAAARDLTPAEIASPEVQKLIDDMVETMHEYDGVGVAAPQVHVGLRLAVLEVPPSGRSPEGVPLKVLVNPRWEPIGAEVARGFEGCLSVPDLRGIVPRASAVRLNALDRHGKPWSVEARGFFARVIQHECDHLEGRVYLDRMEGLRSLSFLGEFERYVLEPPKDADDDEGDGDE